MNVLQSGQCRRQPDVDEHPPRRGHRVTDATQFESEKQNRGQQVENGRVEVNVLSDGTCTACSIRNNDCLGFHHTPPHSHSSSTPRPPNRRVKHWRKQNAPGHLRSSSFAICTLPSRWRAHMGGRTGPRVRDDGITGPVLKGN